MNPLVSIIIPAYNAEKYIASTINSVINQTYTNWELIIINDGSIDTTEAIIENFQRANSKIKTFHQTNQGVSASRNNGLFQSQGNYVFFLDSDDIWKETNIEAKVKILENAHADAVYSSCELMDENSRLLSQFLSGSATVTLDDLLLNKGNYTTAPSGIALKRETIMALNGFDPELSNNADQDLFIRLLANNFKLAFIPEMLWKYRMHSKSMSSNVQLLEKDLLKVFKKAEKANLFRSSCFKKTCFSKVYLILAGSWWKNGGNKLRSMHFLFLSIFTQPLVLIKHLLKK